MIQANRQVSDSDIVHNDAICKSKPDFNNCKHALIT
jgi:hypothetical protein